ncbi:hypothetical protein P4S72_08685 [Vibrio sp. PP-XX7]
MYYPDDPADAAPERIVGNREGVAAFSGLHHALKIKTE